MKNSNIEWTHHTFNPWIGCTKVSPGCANCYAEALMDKRLGRAEWGDGKERKRTTYQYWKQPLVWNQEAKNSGIRARVFCASLADVFDPSVPLSWFYDLFNLITVTTSLDWLALTKRPENIHVTLRHAGDYGHRKWNLVEDWWREDGFKNIWLGVSAEDQERFDARWKILQEIPEALRFISAEPLLGPIELPESGPFPNWIIVGGESGPHSRPMHPEWVRSLRRQCEDRSIAFFFKQWGGLNKHATGRLLDGQLHDAIPGR